MTRKRLGRFKILAETGRGAMGTVYRALDPTIERVVAIKTISIVSPKPAGDKEFRERFFREARAAGRLSHPGIVTIHDVGEDEAVKTPFIVMEYVEGKSLEEVGQGERLPLETALELARQVAEALDYAHSRQIIHRDIKPANIIVTPEGRAKITDFGIARLALSQFTVPGEILGTPSYMAPEQLSAGEVDGRSDLFSLGVILYWMLTGQKPFTGDTASAVAFQIVYKDPPPPSQLNPVLGQEFNYVVERALAKNPDRRYQCGRDLAKDLEDLKASRTPRSRAAFASFGEVEATATAHAETSELTSATATEVLPVQQEERSPGRPVSPAWQRLGAAALAILLYLLLLDSVVETFLSGSPLRGIVAISVGAYFALSAWLWRRMRWPTKAAVSFLFLLGLLAFALWRPESRQEGFYLLQQSTSVLACGISALAVAVAGFILSRLKRLPRAGRVAIGLVAAYGVAGFVLGIKAGTPYSDLYHGASLWSRLPFWLQGAFIGTVLILPAALLFLIVNRLLRFREAQPRSWAYKVLFLALSLAMSLGALTAPALPTVLIPVEGGKIEAVISGGINETYWPTHPTRTIPEDAEKIYAVLKADVSRPVRLEASWIAAKVA
ncbi:MAG: serine/threonine protein kinase, partial [Acidobacteria bacterium]|nr:serine/threonine protein kinase [Acidobacteriota bacterium]